MGISAKTRARYSPERGLVLVSWTTLERLEQPFVAHRAAGGRLVAVSREELARRIRECEGIAHLVDPGRVVRQCSDALAEFLGQPRQKLLGVPIHYHYGLAADRIRKPAGGTPELRAQLQVKADEFVLQQEILEELTKVDVEAKFPDVQTFVYGGRGVRPEWRGLREVWIRADRLQEVSRRFAGRVVTATVTPAEQASQHARGLFREGRAGAPQVPRTAGDDPESRIGRRGSALDQLITEE